MTDRVGFITGASRGVGAAVARAFHGDDYDVVSAGGEYLGGVISPGVEISIEALSERAAALPKVRLEPPRAAIGKGTREAIQSGVIYGYAGQVDGIVARLREELGEEATAISCGLAHSCAVFESGAVRCWGNNNLGQLGLAHTLAIGDDELATTLSPIDLGGSATEVSVGDNHRSFSEQSALDPDAGRVTNSARSLVAGGERLHQGVRRVYAEAVHTLGDSHQRSLIDVESSQNAGGRTAHPCHLVAI